MGLQLVLMSSISLTSFMVAERLSQKSWLVIWTDLLQIFANCLLTCVFFALCQRRESSCEALPSMAIVSVQFLTAPACSVPLRSSSFAPHAAAIANLTMALYTCCNLRSAWMASWGNFDQISLFTVGTTKLEQFSGLLYFPNLFFCNSVQVFE